MLASTDNADGYYRALKEIRDLLRTTAWSSRKARARWTSGRQVRVNNSLPRAALRRHFGFTYGASGGPAGSNCGSQLVNPDKRVVDIR